MLPLWSRIVAGVLLLGGTQFIVPRAPATYALPADRTITWPNSAGLDPVGGIPSGSWTTSACGGLLTGIGNAAANTTTINNCITAASSNTVITLAAGEYYWSGSILLKSNKALRGANVPASPWLDASTDANSTVLHRSTDTSRITFNGGSKTTAFDPATTFLAGCGFNCVPHGTLIASGYSQGSASVTLTTGDTDPSSTYAVGDFIAIYQNKDATATTLRVDDQNLNYLGEDCGAGCPSSGTEPHAFQQYAKITAVSGTPCTGTSGCTVTFTPAIYDTSDTPTGAAIRRQTSSVTTSGIEQLRIKCDTAATGADTRTVFFQFARYDWMTNVETYNCGGDNGGGSSHVWAEFSLGLEFDRNYLHTGASHNSGRNYGFEFYHWNGAFKVENNIVRDTRHAYIQEGGGSGMVWLYNFSDANYEDTGSILAEDCVANHGAHPHMNLWEGNKCQQLASDYTQGSATNIVWYRNWSLAERSGTPAVTDHHYDHAMRDGPYSRHLTIVGNLFGKSAWSTGTKLCNGPSTLNTQCPTEPIAEVFGYHTDNNYNDSVAKSSALLHGNYDYITDSQADWDGGSTHTLAPSLYYSTAPSWWPASCPWPPYDPSGPTAGSLPAEERYNATGSACVG